MDSPAGPKWGRMQKIVAVVLGAGALAGGTVVTVNAIGFEDADSAKQDLCVAFGDLETTVASYQGLDPRAATNDQLDTAYDDITGALEKVDEEGDEWVNAYDNELTDAYWDLYYAVEDLDGGNTAADNMADLEDELAAFPAAFQATFDGSGCSTGS